MNNHFKVGDEVSVKRGEHTLISGVAKVLKTPTEIGDTWVFQDTLDNHIVETNEPCTITKLIEQKTENVLAVRRVYDRMYDSPTDEDGNMKPVI